jgi:hypothetical protein
LACHALKFERHFVAYKVQQNRGFVAELGAVLQIRCTAKTLIRQKIDVADLMLCDIPGSRVLAGRTDASGIIPGVASVAHSK